MSYLCFGQKGRNHFRNLKKEGIKFKKHRAHNTIGNYRNKIQERRLLAFMFTANLGARELPSLMKLSPTSRWLGSRKTAEGFIETSIW